EAVGPHERVVHAVGVLRRAPHDEPATVPGGRRRPHLERAGGQPLVDHALADHDLAAGGPVGGGGAVGGARLGDQVGADLGEEQRLVGQGGVGADDRRQGVDVDDDELGGVRAL